MACPHSVDNVISQDKLKKTKINEAFLGTCTNGRLEDLKIAASILKSRKVAPGVKLIISPASRPILLEALRLGIIDIFVKAGGVFSTPTCGPCLGGHMGILADGEVALATTNRNFLGRMGSPKSLVYLSSPAVAAASAITGRITHPGEVA